MKPHDFPILIEKIDQQIRSGDFAVAREGIEKLRDEKIPREYSVSVSNLTWRCGEPHIGIRILNPIVRADRRTPIVPTEAEVAEYAHCLIRAGATEEAEVLLKTLETSTLPQIHLYRASAHFARWDYESGILALQHYVKSPSISDYQRLVGKVNLVAGCVALRDTKKVTFLLRELLHETSLRRHHLLHGNLLEVAAQHFLFRQKWAEVRQCLSRAEKELSSGTGNYEFFVRKWRAFLELVESKGSEASRKAVAELRLSANALGQWETLRQCDEYEGQFAAVDTLLHKAYFGTPWPKYREMIQQQLQAGLPERFVWWLGRQGKGSDEIDLALGESEKGEKQLKAGQLRHRLLVALAQDFYRPIRLAALHYQLYPGEFFNPVTSPFRVYEAVKRLRNWFTENKIPITVDEVSGAYRLTAEKPAGLVLYLEQYSPTKISAPLLKLRQALHGHTFSVREAADVLETPTRSVQRILENARSEGFIERIGKSRSTRYRFLAA